MTIQLFDRPMTEEEIAAFAALADGIECGAKLTDRCAFSLIDEEDTSDGYKCSTCALGAAQVCTWAKRGEWFSKLPFGKVAQFRATPYDDILAAYGLKNRNIGRVLELTDSKGEDFEAADEFTSIAGMIVNLNDWAGLSREKIAAILRNFR